MRAFSSSMTTVAVVIPMTPGNMRQQGVRSLDVMRPVWRHKVHSQAVARQHCRYQSCEIVCMRCGGYRS